MFLEKNKLEILRNRNKGREIERRKELEDKEATLAKLTEEEEKSRNNVYDEAKKAKTAQCLMDQSCKKLGSTSCDSCVHREGSLGHCKTWNEELPCVKWNTTCTKFERSCEKYENLCTNETMVCYEYGQECIEKAPTVCQLWTDDCTSEPVGYAFEKNVW